MTLSTFSVTDFMSNIDNLGGYARRHKYSVQIIPPTAFRSSVGSGTIDFLAKSVLLPRKGFATTEHRTYGINRTVPYETTFEPAQLTMINTNDWAPRVFWDEWLDHIQNPDTKNMTYYKQCVGTVIIKHYDDEKTIQGGASNYSVTLKEAWPESISEIALAWENRDIQDFEITIRYKEWTDRDIGGEEGDLGSSF